MRCRPGPPRTTLGGPCRECCGGERVSLDQRRVFLKPWMTGVSSQVGVRLHRPTAQGRFQKEEVQRQRPQQEVSTNQHRELLTLRVLGRRKRVSVCNGRTQRRRQGCRMWQCSGRMETRFQHAFFALFVSCAPEYPTERCTGSCTP